MEMEKPLRIAIVAGEASGDLLGGALCKALFDAIPNVQIEGIAGPQMIAAGCEPLHNSEEIAVMGLFEVIKHLPRILAIRKKFLRHLKNNLPDIFIGIDAPDFNLPIEAILKKRGVFTVHYNSPTVWAWRSGRIKKIARAVDLMLTQFPFEAAIYEEHQIPVRYVGHSLADQIPLTCEQQTFRERLNISQQKPIVALLPGSREMEIKRLGPLFLETARWCLTKNSEVEFIIPMVSEKRYAQFQEILSQHKDLPLTVTLNNAHEVMGASDVVLLASGTATLEALLLQRPMVVAYKLSPLSYWIGKRLINIDQFSLPNILAEKKLVPEFIQDEATVENLGHAVMERLTNNQLRQQLIADYRHIHQGLRREAHIRAAEAIMRKYTLTRNHD